MLVVSLLQRPVVQVKQRLAEATTKEVRLVDRQPWDFLISHPVCQYLVTPGIMHARSETEVMTSFSRSVCTSSGITHD
jgi:hypothetical protein